MKNLKLVYNFAGGINLIVNRDSGNPVQVLTGNKKRSLAFWKRLSIICNMAITDLHKTNKDNCQKRKK
jgi:hypothetical protein